MGCLNQGRLSNTLLFDTNNSSGSETANFRSCPNLGAGNSASTNRTAILCKLQSSMEFHEWCRQSSCNEVEVRKPLCTVRRAGKECHSFDHTKVQAVGVAVKVPSP